MKKNYFFESNINRFSNSCAEINYQKVPFDENYNYKLTNKSNPFSDLGAWFGYYLPNENELSFYGPNIISQEIPLNLAKKVSNTLIKINNKICKLENFFFEEKNGILKIKSEIKNKDFRVEVTKKLFFSSKEDALISVNLKINTKIFLNVELLNEICVYDKIKHKSTNGQEEKGDWVKYFDGLNFKNNKITFNLIPLINKEEKEIFEILHKDKVELIDSKKEKNTHFFTYKFMSFDVKENTNKTQNVNWYESFYFNKKKVSPSFDEKIINSLEKENEKRWIGYISKFNKLDEPSRVVAIKSVYTLIGNWLGPNGKIKSNTIIPSRTYADFIGAYAWDIFKIAHGLCEFEPNLAKDIIDSMFDYQLNSNDQLRPWDYGMIPDCIFYNFSIDRGGCGNNWNERNTKPPLASWSVLKVYQKTKDLKWLKKIYPKLVLFQEWWDRTRKAQSYEYFLSYGATLDWRNDINNKKTILEAISWESGMDNAPRFDWDRMDIFGNYIDQKLVSYVIDQISVCLNSFYYIELESLNKIRNLLGKKIDNKLKNVATELKNNVNKYMYSDVDHFYHDIKYNKKKPLVEYGLSIESFLPLYSKIATKTKAAAFIKSLTEDNFLTPFPFPTVAKNNDRFDPTDYWRGPVWISFLYFAILGIYNYDKKLAQKIEKNIIKILNSKKHLEFPLRENYHPITKDGLSTTNFSWTASMLISMIKEIK